MSSSSEPPPDPGSAAQPRPPGTVELASGKLLLDEPAEHVVRLTIARPEQRGALDHELLDAMAETVQRQSARCLVIAGQGGTFSAGYDIGNFDERTFSQSASQLVAHPFTEAIEVIEAYKYPVIAAINGHAIGGGLELALACDIRIAARTAKMGMPPAKIGLIYSHTGLKKFIETCGVAYTNELFHVGRNVDAERALEMGLVNQVVERGGLDDYVVHVAGEIAANAPLSLEGNKRIIRELRRHPGKLPEDLERELVNLREMCFYSDDFREGIKAFGEKREPRWEGR